MSPSHLWWALLLLEPISADFGAEEDRRGGRACKGKYELDTAYPDPGRELNNGKEDKTGSPEACQALCKTNPQCQLWTWGRNGGECWLKKERSLTKKKEEKSLVSGTRKACPFEGAEEDRRGGHCKGKYELDTAYPDPGS